MAYCHPLNAYTTYKPFLYKMNMLLWKWNWSIYKPLATMTLTSTITDYARRISHTRTMLLQILWRSWKCEFKVILLWFLYKHQLKQVSPPPFANMLNNIVKKSNHLHINQRTKIHVFHVFKSCCFSSVEPCQNNFILCRLGRTQVQ